MLVFKSLKTKKASKLNTTHIKILKKIQTRESYSKKTMDLNETSENYK